MFSCSRLLISDCVGLCLGVAVAVAVAVCGSACTCAEMRRDVARVQAAQARGTAGFNRRAHGCQVMLSCSTIFALALAGWWLLVRVLGGGGRFESSYRVSVSRGACVCHDAKRH
eukprot:3493265-Rhodomonas_salina.4